jgi:uncharacterized protein (DUF433 family)
MEYGGLTMLERITTDPDRMGGVPCIRNLRIPVSIVLGLLADGMNMDEILLAYPDLEKEDILDSLRFAVSLSKYRDIPIPAAS